MPAYASRHPLYINHQNFKVMAKSSNFFGLRTGSTKSLTFSVYRGQQITKDRVTRISNPRTTAQMQQRALVPMVAAARSTLKGLVDHSFEGVPYGEASLKEFSAQNLKKDFLKVTSYSPKGYSNMGFAGFLVSKGTIADNLHVEWRFDNLHSNVTIPDGVTVKFPAAKANDSADVIFSYLEKLARDNSLSEIRPGTQVTVLAILKADDVKVNTPTGTKTAPLADYTVVRFLIPDSTTTSEALANVNAPWKVKEDIPAEGTGMVTLVDAKGNTLHFQFSNGALGINYELPIGSPVCVGGAFILSRYSANVWRRNTTVIEFKPNAIDPAFTFDDWASQYGSSASSASEEYLNNGSNSPSGEKIVKPVTPVP